MKLYEIDQRIDELAFNLEPDPETGEMKENWEEMYEELQKLLIKREDILTWLAKLVLNTRSEVESLKGEIARLSTRKKTLENKEKSLMRIIDRECMGEKTDLGIAVVSYRSTEHIEVSDYQSAVAFLEKDDHKDCLKYTEPEIIKNNAKQLIKSGIEIPGVQVVKDKSCSLR